MNTYAYFGKPQGNTRRFARAMGAGSFVPADTRSNHNLAEIPISSPASGPNAGAAPIQRAMYSLAHKYDGGKKKTIDVGDERLRQADPQKHRDIGSDLTRLVPGEPLFIHAHGSSARVGKMGATEMAQHLVDQGLPDHVTHIHIYACSSDSGPKGFASRLQKHLSKKHGRKITVTGSEYASRTDEQGNYWSAKSKEQREEYHQGMSSARQQHQQALHISHFYLGDQGVKKKQEAEQQLQAQKQHLLQLTHAQVDTPDIDDDVRARIDQEIEQHAKLLQIPKPPPTLKPKKSKSPSPSVPQPQDVDPYASFFDPQPQGSSALDDIFASFSSPHVSQPSAQPKSQPQPDHQSLDDIFASFKPPTIQAPQLAQYASSPFFGGPSVSSPQPSVLPKPSLLPSSQPKPDANDDNMDDLIASFFSSSQQQPQPQSSSALHGPQPLSLFSSMVPPSSKPSAQTSSLSGTQQSGASLLDDVFGSLPQSGIAPLVPTPSTQHQQAQQTDPFADLFKDAQQSFLKPKKPDEQQ